MSLADSDLEECRRDKGRLRGVGELDAHDRGRDAGQLEPGLLPVVVLVVLAAVDAADELALQHLYVGLHGLPDAVLLDLPPSVQ